MQIQALTETLTWNTPVAVSAVILVITFFGIFTEGVHGFHRTKFAMAGAGIMTLIGQYFGFCNHSNRRGNRLECGLFTWWHIESTLFKDNIK